MILYFAADLLWASKIKTTADALAIQARPVRSLEMLDSRLADSDPRALLVDLDKGEEALAMIRHAREKAPALRIVAWGPHVDADLLREAKKLGADEVTSRGSMDRRLVQVLQGCSGAARTSQPSLKIADQP